MLEFSRSLPIRPAARKAVRTKVLLRTVFLIRAATVMLRLVTIIFW